MIDIVCRHHGAVVEISCVLAELRTPLFVIPDILRGLVLFVIIGVDIVFTQPAAAVIPECRYLPGNIVGDTCYISVCIITVPIYTFFISIITYTGYPVKVIVLIFHKCSVTVCKFFEFAVAP